MAKPKKPTAGDKKLKQVFHEFKAGALNSGSPRGPKVTNRQQAIAIALSEKARADAKARKAKTRAGAKRKKKG